MKRTIISIAILVAVTLTATVTAFAVTDNGNKDTTGSEKVTEEQMVENDGIADEVENEDSKVVEFEANVFNPETAKEETIVLEKEISEVAVKVLTPETKDDYYHKILNSVDYYNAVSGKLKTNLVYATDCVIEYAVDMNECTAYQKLEGKDINEETYVADYQVFEYDNVKKTRNAVIQKAEMKRDDTEDYEDDSSRITEYNGYPMYHYRGNPTNLFSAASASLFPQDITFGLLANKDMWEIAGETTYLNRKCTVIKGEAEKAYGENLNIQTFEFIVDTETGIVLKFEGFDNQGNVTQYTETMEFSDDTSLVHSKIKALDESKYADYTYER